MVRLVDSLVDNLCDLQTGKEIEEARVVGEVGGSIKGWSMGCHFW